jgi:hypothetical protein
MSGLPESTCRELDQEFRRVLRDAGIKGMLSGYVAHLLDVVERVLLRQTLSTEAIAAAIDRDGGFMRVGEASAFIDGHHVPPGQLVDALLFLRRSPESTENGEES